MMESASRRFLELLEAHRNALYVIAAQGQTPAIIETALQRGVRSAFREYARNAAPRDDLVNWLGAHIQAELGDQRVPAAALTDTAMPADVWARLAAAIQIEAATLGGADEQSMLAYDPLLAPRKKQSGSDDSVEGLNLSPWTRFVIATTIVLFIGIVATIILTTHHAPATTQAAGATASTSPGAVNAPTESRP